MFAAAVSVAGTGTAHAANCYTSVGYPYRSAKGLGYAGAKADVNCDVTMNTLYVTARLYRVVPGAVDVLVATADNYARDSSSVSVTAETVCLPGLYKAAAIYSGIWPDGTIFSRSIEERAAFYDCVIED